MEKSGQIQLSKHDKVMISQRKSIEVVNIFWFGHTSLLLLNKKDVKQTFPLTKVIQEVLADLKMNKNIAIVS